MNEFAGTPNPLSFARISRLVGLLLFLIFLSGCRLVDTILARGDATDAPPPVGFCSDTSESCLDPEATPLVSPSPTPLVAAGPAFPGAAAATETDAAAPTIVFFHATTEMVVPGQTITLTWITTNAITVTLRRITPADEGDTPWNVPASGTFAIPIPESQRDGIRFSLTALTEDGASVTDLFDLSVVAP